MQLQNIISNLSKKEQILTTFLEFYPGKSYTKNIA